MEPVERPSSSGIILVLGAVITWGAYFPFAKIILTRVSPSTFLILRLGIGAAILYGLNLFLHRPLGFARRDWPIIIIAGVVGIILHQLLQLQGLKSTSATNTGWILTLIPPTTGILAWLWLKERVAMRKIVGLAVAMFGVVLLVTRGNPGALSIGRNRGDLFAFLSVGTWSTATVMMKSRLPRCEPLAIAAVHMLLGFVFFTLIGAADFARELPALRSGDWLIITLIGIVPSGLAYYWFAAGLKRMATLDTSMLQFVGAIAASLTGWLVLDEQFTPAMLGAAVIIILGVWIAEHQRRRKGLAFE